jgi:hypothetical protein
VTLMLEAGNRPSDNPAGRRLDVAADAGALWAPARYGGAPRGVTTMHDDLAGLETRLATAAATPAKQAGTKTGALHPGGN